MKPKDKLKITNEHDDIEESFDKFWKDTIYAGLFLVIFALMLGIIFEVFFFFS